MNLLWTGKTGKPHAWYFIYPYVKSRLTKRICVVRQSKIERMINDDKLTFKYFNKTSLFSELWNYFITSRNELRTKNIDLVVSYSFEPWGLIAWILAKFYNKKIVIGFIGSDYNNLKKNTLLTLIYKQILIRTDIITVTGNEMKNGFNEILGTTENIIIFPHCIPYDKLYDRSDKNLNIKNLITVAYLMKDKRTIDIIKAIKLLKDQGIRVKLSIVGIGPLEESLREYVKENNLSNYIDFLGFVDDLNDVYIGSDIFIQASVREGLSLSLVEAIGMEIVPVITNAGSELDIISDKKNGVFFEKKNINDLAKKLKYVLEMNNYKTLLKGVQATKKRLEPGFAIRTAEKIQKLLINE